MFNLASYFYQGGSQIPHRGRQAYSDSLQAFSALSMDRYDLENGNKVLLPASALSSKGPMIFKLVSSINNKTTYVGVLEFIAEEGTIILPHWIYENLGLIGYEAGYIMISLATFLPKAKIIKLQPHETEFIDLPDPRAILENYLRNYVCLTEGETITINFTGKQYLVDIKHVEPNEYKAVDVNDADVEIDFDKPLDFEDAPPLLKKSSTLKYEEEQQKLSQNQGPFSGKGIRLDGKPDNKKKSEDISQQQQPIQYDPRKHRLNHGVRVNIENKTFQGEGLKLGKSTKK